MGISTPCRVGPQDKGRSMALRDFDKAEAREGWRYELSRGVVSVIAIRGFPHLVLVEAFRRQLYDYEFGDPPRPLFKPDEYLGFGVNEYFAVDAAENQVLVYSAEGPMKPQTLCIGDRFPSQAVPGFVLDVEGVLCAPDVHRARSAQ